ncbi:glucose-methanol-choline oxidoreductase [Planoprotostelium fungivorum]|uniref:Glucose-methanol-choline oxidoreductase n=1 Tax=Planoprotostelium fungivorum TaxID=1890364 RepID=A0A2P6NEF4_9EUKA|nr:glucose-methanol-choline oxidoreductase [Planoprotostelium fungivorum]
MRKSHFALTILSVLSAILLSNLYQDDKVFDYVIVGGGAAGSLMASRLSEDSSKTVLVLHRGTDDVCVACDDASAADPAYINAGLHSRNGADYFTSPQLFTQRNIREVRTNLPGGGTRIYGSINIPSSKNLIEKRWPEGLKYDVMLPYLNKLQDHFCHYLPFDVTNITEGECTTWHGKPQDVGMSISPPIPGPDHDFARDLFHGAEKYNITYVPDPWNPHYQSKGSYSWGTHSFHNRQDVKDVQSKRTRESAWTGYLPLSLREKRTNLVYQTQSEARSLIYLRDLLWYPVAALRLWTLPSSNDSEVRVVGVRYEKGGEFRVAFARKEVVLCAGVEGTPHFLQNNGIGPADLLHRLDIPVVVDNPHVGQGIAAHQAVTMVFSAKKAIPVRPGNDASQARMLLSSPLNKGYPDMEIELFLGFPVSQLESASSGYDPLFFTTPSTDGSYPHASVLVEVVDPQWRGSINVTSSVFHSPSQVDYGWPRDAGSYAASEDYQKLSYGFKLIRDIFLGNNSFAEQHIESEIVPGGPERDFMHAAQVQHDIYHLTGGMNIGKATDLKGAVRGLSGLSVCDGGLVPHPPNGNPTTTILALCEYVADQIKAKV